mgnify:CR=1 FL=1
MALNYKKLANLAFEALTSAHNPKKAKIRGYFFKKEYQFFRKHIRNKRVLVAGSGLGHDSFEIAKYNKKVVGVNILKKLLDISKKRVKEMGIKNVKFEYGNIIKLKYKNKYFDVAVLNMGTIDNFDDKEKIIKELLRVSNTVYLDFYPPNKMILERRKNMYQEEGFKDLKIRDDKIISKTGFESGSISKNEMNLILKSINAKAKYYNFCDISIMAEIKENKKSKS